MLLEGYLAKKHTYPKDEIQIVVTATAKSVLAPSWDLLKAYKSGKVTWGEYVEKYKEQIMANPEAIKEMLRIKKLAKTKDVRLICYEKNYPCHRFILLEMIQSLGESAM